MQPRSTNSRRCGWRWRTKARARYVSRPLPGKWLPRRRQPNRRADAVLRCVKPCRGLESLELIVAGLTAGQIGLRACINRLGQQNLAGGRGGLCSRSGIDHGADRRDVGMRMSELAKTELSAIDADAYAH